LILSSRFSLAQAGEWTWMKGLNGYNGAGVFGTLGVPDSNNTPPALFEPAEFKDLQGRFWLFGGNGTTYNSRYNALWMYDKTSNEWTWESGSSSQNQYPHYGTKGVPSTNNHPGARGDGFPSWVDNNGLLWLFGGYGYDSQGLLGILNDLWSYNIATSEWTWVSGSKIRNQNGVYGTQGVPDTANHPGSRWETNASWVSDDNSLWFFGGLDAFDVWNDLWKYDLSTNEWTWMSGSNTCCQSDSYGTLGVPAPGNHPGARWTFSKWRDSQNNFWMFGGFMNTSFTFHNDLWKYDPSSNEWTWMSGSNIGNDEGTYTTTCDASSVDFPGSRTENRACWIDEEGKFWFFGGSSNNFGTYNDLWYYNPSTNEWMWSSGSSGSNDSAIYGIQGVPAVTNHPAAYLGSIGWVDSSCQLWMFGGMHTQYNTYSNTLWKFIPGCGACNVASFAASDPNICEKFCNDFTDQSTNNPTSWQWQFPGGTPSFSTNQNPTNICYNEPGSYDVTLITTNANGSDTLTLLTYITVYPTPAIPTIIQNGYTLTASTADFYQWQLDAVDIPGVTNQSYDVLQTGFYTVIVSDSNSCKNSTTLYVEITGIDEVNDGGVSIYPNPSSGNLFVEFMDEEFRGEVSINLVNSLSQKIYSSSENISSSSIKKEITLTKFTPGVYFIEVKSSSYFLRRKIILSK